MISFRENPESTLKEFQNFRDKVASCVSLDDIEKKATILKAKSEWLNYNSKLLTTSLNEAICEIYEGMGVKEKLKELHELDKENEENAWRPQTGKPELSSIEGNHLEKEKKFLKKNIMQIKKESAILQAEISDFRKQIEEQQIQLKEFTSSNSEKV